MDREKYVMLGHSHIIGDLIEIIHLNNGILTKIVQNITEPAYKGRPYLKQRLARLQDINFNQKYVNQLYPISVQSMANFTPQQDEKYIIGFTGFKMLNFVQDLTQNLGIQFTSLIHPSTIIAPNVQLSPGSIIQAGAIIASGVKIKEHTFINKGVNIDCNTTIERFASLAPGTIVGQNTLIGTGVMLGIGSVILDGLVVHNYSMVAAGATVVEYVPSHTLVAGIPAVIKKTNLYKTI
ncbi:MAG: hypothetical protein F6K10_08145 [Moorea sp. SIO2B7]|nr:hypothetical protein [Moorena sp. SIO2B7]